MSIRSKIQALITAANTKTGESDTTLTDAVQTLVDGYGQGGTTISDGIVVKARDANGYATEIDFYGSTVQPFQFFGQNSSNTAWKSLSNINWKDTVVGVKNNAFMYANRITALPTSIVSVGASGCANMAALASVNMPNLTTVAVSAFYGDTSLTSIILPKVTNAGFNNVFGGCTSLTTAQLGSIGYGVTNISNTAFVSDTQSGLTITIYTNGSYADTVTANARNKATNATIIIKASEATTYGGTSYAAGDTILTSTP